MIAVVHALATLVPWQLLLNGIGWLLAKIYEFVPNYGLSIILLTLLTRLVLLPLGVKQIRSMQAMQAIQPKVKAIQQKYKGNRQKQNEEVMKIYQEHGVNPLSGCWPMLLQLPILITFYSVLRYPAADSPPHLPADSALHITVEHQFGYVSNPPKGWHPQPSGQPRGSTQFLGMNLLCSAQQAGQSAVVVENHDKTKYGTLDCGKGIPTRIPYFLLVAVMVATTFFQQRQMQQASPPGSSQQQQMLTRIMPLMFGFWGYFFPASLTVYWTFANLIQIGQQQLLLKAAHLQDGAPPAPKPKKKNWLAGMLEQAQQERDKRPGPGASRPQAQKKPDRKPGPKPQGKGPAQPLAGSDGSGTPTKSQGSGGTSAGDRKKRRKR